MKILLRFLCVISTLGCVSAQISLVESGPGTVKPTETLDMTCKVTGASLTDRTNMYGVNWVRQPEGKGLEWLGAIWHDNSKAYAQSLQGRVTLTRDTNKGEVYLKLTGVKPEKSGKYYCVRYSGAWYNFDVWGNGQSVLVTSATQQAPSLFPLISCGKSQDFTNIGCLARGFLPETIDFTWGDKSNKSFTNGLKTYSPVLHSTGTYIASSQVKVTSGSWENRDPYYCTTKHLDKSTTVQVVNPGNGNPTKPVVTMHAPVKNDLKDYGNGTIICLVSDFYPNGINVNWLKNNLETTLNTVTKEAKENGNGQYTVSSSITVSSKEWNEDNTFSCVVEHSASGFSEIKNLSKSQVCEAQAAPGDIQVTVVRPSFETIFLSKKAPLTCVISNMGTVDGLEVSWYEVGTENKLDTTLENAVYQDNGYSANATATVCAEDWDVKKYECRVKHPDLTSPKNILLVKENGQGYQVPTVLLYPPHPDEMSKKEYFTVTCLVKNFSPKDIFVKWQIGGELQTKHVVTTEAIEEPYPNGGKSYFLYSTLTILNTQSWNNGTPVTCLVGHESLPLQLTQKTIDKTTGKPTSVNVSLVMSDSC